MIFNRGSENWPVFYTRVINSDSPLESKLNILLKGLKEIANEENNSTLSMMLDASKQ